MKIRVIGFGNTVMRDDAVAIHVVRKVQDVIRVAKSDVDVVESSVAGFDLLELMRDWDRVVLVEAVQLANRQAGDVMKLDPLGKNASLRVCALREADVATIMEAGTNLGYSMPAELAMIGIQAADVCTFGEEMTPSVVEAVPKAVEMVLEEARVMA